MPSGMPGRRRKREIELDGRPGLLTERQVEANELLASPARHICLPGGARSGKTAVIIRAIMMRALRARSLHVVLRFRASAVWPSIGLQTIPFVASTFFPGLKLKEKVADRRFDFPNGSQIWLGGLDEKARADKILGNEYSSLYFNECSQIPYPSVLIAQSRLAQVVPGLRQRAYYDLNPMGKMHWTNVLFGDLRDPVSKRLLSNPDIYKRLFMQPADNAKHLSKEYLESLDDLPSRARMRFRDGAYGDEAETALWDIVMLEACRVHPSQLPHMQRVVVAVDPSGAKSEIDSTHDEIGIMVVGLGTDMRGYVLADCSMLGGPNEWGSAAVAAYHYWKADALVAEINYGGAMVEHVIRTVDQSVNYVSVTASRGKVARAEPVAALYERHRISHAGTFEKLEDELCEFTDMGYVGARSPNRADACVWGFTNLMLEDNAAGWVEYYRLQLANGAPANVVTTGPGQPRPTDPAPPPEVITLRTPTPFQAFFASAPDGRSQRFTSDDKAELTVPVDFVASLVNAGCTRQPLAA